LDDVRERYGRERGKFRGTSLGALGEERGQEAEKMEKRKWKCVLES
jgi:hypothetical protein